VITMAVHCDGPNCAVSGESVVTPGETEIGYPKYWMILRFRSRQSATGQVLVRGFHERACAAAWLGTEGAK
jgi:hypothetical protein